MTMIGFIGLGNMGMPMALRLMQHHQILPYDSNPDCIKNILKDNSQPSMSLKQLASSATVIFTMLPSPEIFLNIYQQLFPLLKKNTLLIDCSTIGPKAAIEWHQQAQTLNLPSIDAPVSGGTKAAEAGSLSFIVGGLPQHIELALPYLQCLGKKIIITGAPGSGQAAKICNNLVLANTMIAVSEAFCLANTLNLPPEKLLEVLQTSSGNSWIIENYLPVPDLQENVPANHAYQAGFSSRLMLKDLNLALEAASNLQLNLSRTSQTLYQALQDSGYDDKDFSYIYQFLKQK